MINRNDIEPEVFGLTGSFGDFYGLPAKIDLVENIPLPTDPVTYYDSPHRVLIRQAAATAYDTYDFSVIRDAAYTGGAGGGNENSGYLNTAFRVQTFAGQDALSNEIGATFVLANKAPGAAGIAGPQNWAASVFVEKEVRVAPTGGWVNPADARTGHTGGMVIQFNDRSIESSAADATGASPLEVSYRGKSQYGLGKTCLNLTAVPLVGTHTEMDQMLGLSMIGDVEIERLIAIDTQVSIEFPTSAEGTYNYLFNEPAYSLSRVGNLRVNNVTANDVSAHDVSAHKATFNRVNSEAGTNSGLTLQIDSTSKGYVYVDNSTGLQLEAEGAKARLNPASNAFEPVTSGALSLGQATNRWLNLVLSGTISAAGLPVAADEAAAGTAGLASGAFYRTAGGELRVKL